MAIANTTTQSQIVIATQKKERAIATQNQRVIATRMAIATQRQRVIATQLAHMAIYLTRRVATSDPPATLMGNLYILVHVRVAACV